MSFLNFASNRSSTGYLPTLDGWRAVAIVLVMFSHATESIHNALPFLLTGDLTALKKLGLFGVQMFFGLSGFLITSKLLQEEMRNGRISLRYFYMRRIFRILPAALGLLVVVGLLSWAGVLDVSMGRWLSTLMFAANYSTAEHSWYLGHFWSLAVEEHFYFLWPVAFLLLRTDRRKFSLVLACAVAVAVWRLLDFKFHLTSSSAAEFWGRTDIQADGILWGVCVALLAADPVWGACLRRFFMTSYRWPLLCLVLLGLQTLPEINWKLSFLLISIKALLIPLLIYGTLVQQTTLVGRILETSAFRWLGRLSYSLYLWQQLFLVWAEDIGKSPGFLQTFPVNLVDAFACAILSLVLIEMPLIAIGHRIAKQRSSASQIATTV